MSDRLAQSWRQTTKYNGRFRGNQYRTQWNLLPPTPPVPLSKRIITRTLYTPGMKLKGPGTDPVKNRNFQPVQILAGEGTSDDPTIGCLFNLENLDGKAKRQYIEIGRQVARRNGFKCIILRTQAHQKQCTYTVWGQRTMGKTADGRQITMTVPADNHITVYMGPDPKTAMVEGHIFVTEVSVSPGHNVLKQLDNPKKQRQIVQAGYGTVAEEFWLTQNAWIAH